MTRRKLLAALCLASLAANAQDIPRAGETIDVSIVNVDVFITDSKGNRVRGLTRDDFEILENGTPRPISNFAEYASGGTERVGVEGREAQEAPREKRNILLFFEQMQLSPAKYNRMFDALRETVTSLVEPGDSVSVVQWSRNGIHVDEFTDDVSSITASIDLVAADSRDAQVNWEEVQQEEAALMRQFLANAAQMAATGGGKLPTSRNAPAAPPASGGRPLTVGVETGDGPDVQQFMLASYNEMKMRVAAINSAITSMSGLEGKKILILATRRLGEIAGAEFAYGSGGQKLPSHLRERYSTDQLMKSIVDNANASGVTIYPIHPPGVTNAMPATTGTDPEEAVSASALEGAAARSLMNETLSLAEIAKKTGGLMAAGPGDVIELLPRLASDVTDYYSLAYRVPASGGDLTRDIVVRTKKPGLQVRARRQFVEKSDDSRMRDRLRSTLFRASQDSQIPITATAGQPKGSGKTHTVPVQIRIPISALTMLPQASGKHAGSFSVYVAAAADLDELSEVTEKTQPFEVEEARLETAREGYFTYDVDVEVNDKSRYVAVGVLDEVGKTYGLMRVDLKAE